MQSSILLVNSDHNLSSLYGSALVNEGYVVSRTYSEDDAIAYLEKTRCHFDLIIMDHNPAYINGILATIEMRRIDPEAKVLLIAENRKARDFAHSCGALNVIKRPKTIENFLWTAERCTQTNGQRSNDGGERTSESIFHVRKEKYSLKSPRKGMEQKRKKSPVSEIGLDGKPFPSLEQVRPTRRQRRLRSNRNIASAIFIFLLFGALLWNSLSTEASTPNTAIVVVDIHASHIMETKDFDLFFNDNLRFSGVTGDGTYVHLILEYLWNSTVPAMLDIFAFSSSGVTSSRWAGSLNVSNGGTFYVYIHL
jgi:CheY-like chemotaxis protein